MDQYIPDCRYYLQGYCRDWRACLLQHDPAIGTVWKDYMEGDCRNLQNCQLNHVKGDIVCRHYLRENTVATVTVTVATVGEGTRHTIHSHKRHRHNEHRNTHRNTTLYQWINSLYCKKNGFETFSRLTTNIMQCERKWRETRFLRTCLWRGTVLDHIWSLVNEVNCH